MEDIFFKDAQILGISISSILLIVSKVLTPILALLIAILTIVFIVLGIRNRYIDNKLKKRQLRELELKEINNE